MLIGLCTTCKGRAHHLEQTLPVNVERSSLLPVQFHVVDYDSQDDIGRVLSGWPQATVARSGPHRYYNSSHAKNIAAMSAIKGGCDVVVNVDADVYITTALICSIQSHLAHGHRFLSSWGGDGGLCGLIAMNAGDFLALRGYDEGMPAAWGYDDTDLKVRALNYGLEMLCPPPHLASVIQHGDSERMKHMAFEDKMVGYKAKTDYVAGRTGIINPNGFGTP